jgi:hypothetical protein
VIYGIKVINGFRKANHRFAVKRRKIENLYKHRATFGAYSIPLFISIRLSIESCSNVFNKILPLLRETGGARGRKSG